MVVAELTFCPDWGHASMEEVVPTNVGLNFGGCMEHGGIIMVKKCLVVRWIV